jgi:putative membrane protein
MIVHPRPRLRDLFRIWHLSILPEIGPRILQIALFAAVVAGVDARYPAALLKFSVAPFTLLGIALSIFLGFRNSACYERWWEARHQLGMLVSEVRSLSRLTLTLPGGNRPRREQAVRRIIGFVYALIAHLRNRPAAAEVALYTPSVPTGSRLPNALLRALAAEYAAMLDDGEFGEQIFQRIDERLSNMATIQAACERLGNTPVPFAYTLLLHRTAYSFCFLLPFGLVGTFGLLTPIFSALIAYAFFGLDEVGSELEEPFGDRPNALPLSAMARTMEISLLEALDAADIPEPLRPKRSILV